jgi:hypothetical protein
MTPPVTNTTRHVPGRTAEPSDAPPHDDDADARARRWLDLLLTRGEAASSCGRNTDDAGKGHDDGASTRQ